MRASNDRAGATRTDRAAPAHIAESARAPLSQHGGALAILIIAVVVMAIIPDIVHYLTVQHVPVTVRNPPPRSALTKAATWSASAVLFLVCLLVLLRRGNSDRRMFGATVLLLGLVVPYVVSPVLPGTADMVWIALAAAVILAAWTIGATVDDLKWVPITGSMIGAYSMIGGLLFPQYMMYSTSSDKAVLLNWQLAGPFSHSNVLGIYCVLSLALSPLIVNVRWRMLNVVLLVMTIAASASRTALIAVGVLALWWIISRTRSVKFIRMSGTALICLFAATVVILPLLDWNRRALTGRGRIWTASLDAWEESRLIGLGVDWFTTTARSLPYFASWENLGSGGPVYLPSHGHNFVVDTLVRSGLVGLCVLVLILLVAIRSTRAFDVRAHQIASFGYLITFLALSATEAIWAPLPAMELFPVVGLVFAVLIVARPDSPSDRSKDDRLLG